MFASLREERAVRGCNAAHTRACALRQAKNVPPHVAAVSRDDRLQADIWHIQRHTRAQSHTYGVSGCA